MNVGDQIMRISAERGLWAARCWPRCDSGGVSVGGSPVVVGKRPEARREGGGNSERPTVGWVRTANRMFVRQQSTTWPTHTNNRLTHKGQQSVANTNNKLTHTTPANSAPKQTHKST